MEAFFRTHTYLVEHTHVAVRRTLMDEIDWRGRLIGIKGTRGVGKTTFLLEIAKERFDARDRRCLYINMNNFYFQGRGIHDFAGEFYAQGGRVLLIDQIFKKSEWNHELRRCYDDYPELQIIFTGSSVMRLLSDPMIGDIVACYSLRGFSFREYVNLKTDNHFHPHTLEGILQQHETIAHEVAAKVDVESLFKEYLHHGFYPFFLEHTNYSENLLKTMNMMIEVDVLLIRQIELKYLTKIKKLYYLLALETGKSPNVSKLAETIDTSRATVMNYIKYLTDARLMNMLYPVGESFPKKPSKVYMYNSNLMYPIRPMEVNAGAVRESFFYNQLLKDNKLNEGNKNAHFLVNTMYNFRIEESMKVKNNPDMYYAVDKTEIGEGNMIPLWLFGFLY